MNRPRIVKTFVSLVEEKEFEPNCASKNAKLLHKYNEFEVEVWIDQHYEKRIDERNGIEVEAVTLLLINSFKHLLDIYLRFPRFTFINFFDQTKPQTNHRLVLKGYKEDSVLNVVVEIHFLDTSKYEITVITAMEIDDFKVADGQYVVCVSTDKVTLNRNVNKTINEIFRRAI